MSEEASRTKIVVGLGNPGAKYDGTRHNVGFDVLNCLATSRGATAPRAKFEGQLTSIKIGDTPLILVWPLTYMNNSGRCVKAVASFYKVDFEHDLLVICDDLSLPVGKLRMRAKGSAGGQKGLNDIIRVFGSQHIARLRVGIDSPPPEWETADYVLGRFRKDERMTVDVAVSSAVDTIVDWCSHDINYCMNRVN